MNPSKQIAAPSLRDLLDEFKLEIFSSLNCCQVARIESYDSAKGTVSVQPLFKRNVRGRVVSRPLAVDCPVFTLQGGDTAVQLPIAVGDTCLLILADRNLDTWFSTGSEAEPATARMHDLSDGIALVGLNSLQSPKTPLSAGEGGMTQGNAKLALKSGKVCAQNDSGSLKAVLTDLITGIQGATAPTGGGPLVDTTGKIAGALTELNALLYAD